jgi:hypothetical protein
MHTTSMLLAAATIFGTLTWYTTTTTTLHGSKTQSVRQPQIELFNGVHQKMTAANQAWFESSRQTRFWT